MKHVARFVCAALAVGSFVTGCSSRAAEDNDPPQPLEPNVLGEGERIRDVANPAKKRAGSMVNVTATVATFVDQYDETKDGKSRGTVYIQDVGTPKPYSGTSLFAPTFVPANLRLAPGDVLDFAGRYVELATIGTSVVFDTPESPCKGCVLPQLERPAGKFRYEAEPPEPIEINALDLNSYATGRKWLNMVVTIRDAQIYSEIYVNPRTHRATAHITPEVMNAEGKNNNASATVTNEFFEISTSNLHLNYKCKELRGIVTWFFNFHVAPRTPDDLIGCEKI